MIGAMAGVVLSGLIFLILHVTGSGSFPRPLSAQEEQQCLEKMKQGDSAAKAMLIEHNLRLVAHIIKKYYSSSNDQDDLISIGTIGLIKAVNTFDSAKGIRLSSYAARCIENAILPLRTHKNGKCLFYGFRSAPMIRAKISFSCLGGQPSRPTYAKTASR